MKRILSAGAALAALATLAACDAAPREQYLQWVARDAWDSTCAEKAMIETWKADNKRWKVKGQVYVADVDAKFRLTDDCQSGLPLVGKSYKALEVVTFQKTGLEISACQRGSEKGWSLPGKESERCWTGPTLFVDPAAKK